MDISKLENIFLKHKVTDKTELWEIENILIKRLEDLKRFNKEIEETVELGRFLVDRRRKGPIVVSAPIKL